MSAAALEGLGHINKLRLASMAEASTLLLLLLVAVPLKHLLGFPEATRLLGPVHGAAFIAYIWCVIAAVTADDSWSRREIARLILAAFVPFGGFANIPLFRRKAAAISAQALRP